MILRPVTIGAIVLGVGAGPAAAKIPVVAETALTTAARACIGLPADAAAARRLLAERGWERGEVKSRDGTTVTDSSVEPYGRDGVLLLFTATPPNDGCLALAGVKRSLKTKRIIAIVAAALGRAPLMVTDEGAVWTLADRQGLMLRHARKGDETTVQMIVTTVKPAQN